VPPKLLEHSEAIRLKLKAKPDVTLEELRAWLLETHQISISLRGIWRTLRRLDVTRKNRPGTPRSKAVPMSRQGRPGAISSRSWTPAG
jgi:transposase